MKNVRIVFLSLLFSIFAGLSCFTLIGELGLQNRQTNNLVHRLSSKQTLQIANDKISSRETYANTYLVINSNLYNYNSNTSNNTLLTTSNINSIFNQTSKIEIIFAKDNITNLAAFTFENSQIASTLTAEKQQNQVIVEIDYLTHVVQMSHSLDADYTLGELATNTNTKITYANGEFLLGNKKDAVSLTAATNNLTAQVLFLRSGTYTISNTTYTASSTLVGRAIYQSGGTLNLTNLTLDGFNMGNGGNGGALYISNGTANITNSTIKNCSALSGGAILNDGGTINLTGGTIVNNTAKQGGGAYLCEGTFNLGACDISSNVSSTTSGDLYIESDVYVTLSQSLNTKLTVYKEGITDFFKEDLVTSYIAYSSDDTYLASSIQYLEITNLPDGADLSYSSKNSYLVCQRDVFGLFDSTTNERIYTWNELLYKRMLYLSDGVLYGGDNSMEGNLVISNAVTAIGENAFNGYSRLQGITIPKTVTSIAYNSFYACNGLQSIAVDEANTVYSSHSNCLIDNNSNALLLGCNTSVIPDFIIGVNDNAFKGCAGLTSITIPNSATYIGANAFDGCTGLTNATLGNNLIYVSWESFRYCISLQSITIPDSVTTIGGNAFYDCTSLKSASIGSGVTQLDNYAFYNCTALQSLTYNANISNETHGESNIFMNIGAESETGGCDLIIGDNTTSISAYMFHYVTTIKSVTMGSSVAVIRDSAFKGCSGITTLDLSDALDIIEVGAFVDCTGLTSINIPDLVTKVDGWAFYNCYNVTSLTLGNSVQTIGDSAFQGCYQIEELIIPDSVRSIGNSVFNGATCLKSLDLGNGIEYIGSEAFRYCIELTEIIVPYTVTAIGNSAFYECLKLQSLTYNANITEGVWGDANIFKGIGIESETGGCDLIIGDETPMVPAYMFFYVTSIKSILIEYSATRICDSAFKGCSGVTSIEFSESITSIEIGSFVECTGLTSITIPDSVTSIEGWAFYECYNVTSITLGNSVQTIGDSAFQGCYQIEELIIPDSVRSIGSSVFNGATCLKSLDLGNGIEYIGREAFRYCIELTNLNIPASVIDIGNNAFYDCKKLQTLTYNGSVERNFNEDPNVFRNIGSESETGGCELIIGDDTTIIPGYMFYYIADITSVTFGNSVTEIRDSAFKGMSKLTSIELPNSLIKIEIGAFVDCTALTNLTFPNSLTTLDPYTFYNCSNLTSVKFGRELTSIGDSAFEVCENVLTYDFTACSNIPTIGNNIFGRINSNCEIYVPNSLYFQWINSGNWVNWQDYIIIRAGLFETGTNNLITPWSELISSGKINVENGVVTATSAGKGLEGDLVLSNNITQIGTAAFQNCYGLTGIVIGNEVTQIEQRAFLYCEQLQTVSIGESVTTIGSNAFYSCLGLTTIKFPAGLTEIGDLAFAECVNITTYDFTACTNVPTLGAKSFQAISADCKIIVSPHLYNEYINSSNWGYLADYITVDPGLYETVTCSLIYSWEELISSGYISISGTIINDCIQSLAGDLVIAEGITTIGIRAFEYCKNITSVVIPNTTTSIEDYAFVNCENLKSVTIGSSVANIGARAFYCCGLSEQLVIPNSVTTIGEYAFYDCHNITSLVLGSGVTSIGSMSFYNCYHMAEVYNLSSLSLSAGNYNYGYVVYYATVVYTQLGDSLLVTDEEGFVTYTNGSSVSLVRYDGNLTDIIIPDYINDINKCAFTNNTQIVSVIIPSSVKNIRYKAFYNCSNLKNVTMQNGITSIESYAFAQCKSLTSITIPSSVRSISQSIFENCDNLISLVVDSANTTYHSSGNCIIKTSSKTLVAGCKTSVIPTDGSVTSIGDYAFSYCIGLTNITIPSSVTTIGNYAFYYCGGLTSITIPSSVTSIGNYSFFYCSGLTSITIPSSVTSIGKATFRSTNITSVFIPISVTTITASSYYYDSPFEGCSSNLVIYCEANEKQSGWGTYWNYRTANATHIVHYGCTRDANGNIYYSDGTLAVSASSASVNLTNYEMFNDEGNGKDLSENATILAYIKKDDDTEELEVILNKEEDTDTPPTINKTTSV